MKNSTANNDTRGDSGNQDLTNMERKTYPDIQSIGQVSQNPLTCILKF